MTSTMNGQSERARALVTHRPIDGMVNWKLENVTVPSIQDELLVRVVASGVCHTDVAFSLRLDSFGIFPRILGHEGAGYVEKTGSAVTVAKVGDPVLLSFASCTTCKSCTGAHPAHCPQMPALNYLSEANTFYGESGEGYGGKYFGQSSFASMTACKESSVVNVAGMVKNEEELKKFAPLGCGFQTGAGAVTNIAQAGKKDTIVILGLGGVGLAALMAAKLSECHLIIGVDRFKEKVEMAKSLGASHVINTSDPGLDLVEAIKSITDGYGASITIETTGNMDLIKSGLDFTALRGQFVFVGIPPADAELNVHLVNLIQSGKCLRGCIEGDSVPGEYIPQMIQWNREGKFPLDDIIKYYAAEDWEEALADMKSGITIKPVLTF
ncbi:alcohol dehydrogenase [Halenospora varia]|nr:alcohol dehydrogenase [Halenospora varia]